MTPAERLAATLTATNALDSAMTESADTTDEDGNVPATARRTP